MAKRATKTDEGTESGSTEAPAKKRSASKYEPVKAMSTVDTLPETESRSPIRDVVEEVVANGSEQWTPIDAGGRKPESLQSSLTGAANKMGTKLETRIRPYPEGSDEKVLFARVKP